jgi:hypothetical protein
MFREIAHAPSLLSRREAFRAPDTLSREKRGYAQPAHE